MSHSTEREYTCPYCGRKFAITTWDSVNAAADPDLRDRCVDGDIFRFSCPHCKRDFMVQYPLVYSDPVHKFVIWVSTAAPGIDLHEAAKPLIAQGYTLRQATHSVSFYLALLLSLCIGTACGLQGLTAPYGAAIGLSAASAALLASFSMVGNMTSKFLSGSLNERFGAYRTTFWLGVVSLAGFLLLWSGRAPLLQIGAAGSGAITCMNAVVVAYYTRALFGDKQYALIYPYVSITATMPSSLSISLFGLLYDKTGSYDLDFLLCAVCLAVLLVLLPVTFAVNRRERTRLSD